MKSPPSQAEKKKEVKFYTNSKKIKKQMEKRMKETLQERALFAYWKTPSTTPPKPTIREKIDGLIGYLMEKARTYYAGGLSIEEIRSAEIQTVDKLLALLSPQTGEGECKYRCVNGKLNTLEGGVADCPHCSPSTSEEMEREFDGLELRTTEAEPPYTMVVDRKQVKAFLRKQLDLQEKRFLDIIGEDEKVHTSVMEPYTQAKIMLKNEFKAELRSKLSSKGEGVRKNE